MGPTIGIMIGFYIITKMFQTLTEESEAVIVKVFAVITILVVAVGVFSLFYQSLG